MPEVDVLAVLEQRLGRRYARQRLGIEKDHEAQIFGQGITFFHLENLTLSHALIRAVLDLKEPHQDNVTVVAIRPIAS